MLGGLFYLIPELPLDSPAPIAIEQVAPEPEPKPELNITVVQTLPEFASVWIDLPPRQSSVTALKTEMESGILNIRYGEIEKHIPIFPSIDTVILHSEFTENRVILEVSKL